VGDFNGDGKPDLAVANKDSNNVSVFLGNGDGSFRNAVNYNVGAGPVSLAVADFNGDGKQDLAVADGKDNNVTLLLGNGDGTFRAGLAVPAGTNPLSVAAADFNGDGKQDLAVVSGGKVNVLLGNGDGTFAAPVAYDANFNPTAVVVGDFNGDHKPDIAVAHAFPSGDGVSVLLNNGNGTFAAAVKYNAGGNAATLTVGDFNGDGKLDLATANGGFGNNSVSILLGNGDGSFGAPLAYAADQNPVAVAAGDFNKDGKQDLVVVNADSKDVSLLIGNGNGTFVAPRIYPGISSPGVVVAGDFNGDGKTDVVVANTGSLDGTTLSVLLGNGDGTFKDPLKVTGGASPRALVAGDFNGDGKLDLVMINDRDKNLDVFLGNGDGTFKSPVGYAAGASPVGLAVGDFRGDGKLDLVVVNNTSSGTVTVLLGNGDGTFGVPVSYATGPSSTAVAVGDFNGDGKLDIVATNDHAFEPTVSVLFGNGDGTFAPAVSYSIAGNSSGGPTAVAVGDFNHTGKPSIAVTTFFGSDIVLLRNLGDGTFAAPVRFPVGSNPKALAVADFDGDGNLDLVAVNNFGDTVTYLPGNGNNSFGPAVNYTVGDRPLSVAVGDFKGDGNPDMFVTDSNANSVAVLMNALPPAGVLTHFDVSAPVGAAGVPATVTVTALDHFNKPINAYAGTVHFTSSNASVVPPADYTFTAADRGVHAFTLTPGREGTFTLVVTDPHGGVIGSTTIATTDGPLTLSLTTLQAKAGAAFTGVVASLRDSDPNGRVGDFTATIDWGDSQTSAGTVAADGQGGFNITASHTYANTGSYSLAVSIQDVGGAVAKANGTVTVTSAPPVTDGPLTTTGLNAVATEGAAFTGVVASFTDANSSATAGQFTASINWGDGQTSAGPVTANGQGGFNVTGSHTYAKEGAYPAAVTITGAAGATATSGSTVHVARSGPPPANLLTVANALSASAEYFRNLVTGIYQRYLGRGPDPTGLAAWVALLQGSLTDEQLEAGFIGSPEYIQNHGGTGENWVRGMYHDLLGRSPDAAGLSAWLTQLQQGVSPATIALGFAASAEREGQRVAEDYQRYLGREPATAEVNLWVDLFVNHGARNEQVIGGFVGSPEYFQRHYNDARDWLFSAYQDILGRAPDDAGANTWLGLLGYPA
jgi:hypothetical protein